MNIRNLQATINNHSIEIGDLKSFVSKNQFYVKNSKTEVDVDSPDNGNQDNNFNNNNNNNNTPTNTAIVSSTIQNPPNNAPNNTAILTSTIPNAPENNAPNNQNQNNNVILNNNVAENNTVCDNLFALKFANIKYYDKVCMFFSKFFKLLQNFLSCQTLPVLLDKIPNFFKMF